MKHLIWQKEGLSVGIGWWGRGTNLIKISQNDENERKERNTELNLEANISEREKKHMRSIKNIKERNDTFLF